MIQEKIIPILKPVVTKKEIEYICDVCGKIVKNNKGCYGSRPIMECTNCKIDVCISCRYLEYDIGSDYPDGCYCFACWEIGKKYKKLMVEHEMIIEKLHKEWKTECKKNRKENPVKIQNGEQTTP
jgi:hypothetical protein